MNRQYLQLDAPPGSHLIETDPAAISHSPSTPFTRRESARVWRHRSLPAVELFHGSYRKHDFAPHYHDSFTIGVVERGVMHSWCRRARHVAPAGSIILYNLGEVHAPGPGNDDPWSFRTFYLDSPIFRAAAGSDTADRMHFKQTILQDRELAAGLLQLHRSFEKTAASLELQSSLLLLLKRLILRHGGVAETASPRREPEKVSRVRDFIHEHYWEDVKLSQLAKVASLSQYHLLRTFRDIVGLTTHEYLIQTRVEAAKKLLRSGTSPAEVAAATGFVDQSHFHRHFKRLVGATPGQYHPKRDLSLEK